MKVKLRTHAKVNLYLRVVGRRPDGFHELETILHGVGLADEIDVARTSTGKVQVSMELGPGLVGIVPAQEDNTASMIVSALESRGARHDGLAVEIRKAVPLAAGLGGGSANAAGVLVVLNEVLELNLNDDELLELASSVGSDVPYCLKGGTTLALGRGEKLTKLPAPIDMWFVLGMSNEPLLTREVYAQWDLLDVATASNSALITMALGSDNIAEVARHLHNDLEHASFHLRPELAGKKQALLDAGALGAAQSGSGPTLYGLAASEADAEVIARSVQHAFDRVLVVSSQAACIERLDA